MKEIITAPAKTVINLNTKNPGSVLLMRKFTKMKTASGTTDITLSKRKLFLKPVVLTAEIITADIIQIATVAYFPADKSISSFKNNSETNEFKAKTDNAVEAIILIIYPVNNPFELVADILGIKNPSELFYSKGFKIITLLISLCRF